MQGTGFTPKTVVRSHLKRPDGTEFPALTHITDDRGQFVHGIDTHPLEIGVHEVWVEQSAGAPSNVAKFEVLNGEAPLK
jgi:hypothetical protein